MPKPEPIQYLPRILSAALVAGCVWLLLQTVANPFNFQTGQLQRQMAPYLAALSSGDLAKARTLFDKDIHSNPADPGAYLIIAQACVKSDRYDLAIEYLNRGVEACKSAQREQRAALYVTLSDCYHITEKTKPQRMAIQAARNALDIDPEDPEVLNAYGYMLAESGEQLDEALQKTGHALELLKKLPDSMKLRRASAQIEDSYGWVLYKQGHYDAAISALEQAISDVPRDDNSDQAITGDGIGELYYHLGAAYNGKKDVLRARRALQTALTYSPKHKEATAELAALESAAPAPSSGVAAGPENPAGASGASKGGAVVSPAPAVPAPTDGVKQPKDSVAPTPTKDKPAPAESGASHSEKHL